MGRWQEVEHAADLALRVWGQDLIDLFAAAARGMFALLAAPSATGAPEVFTVELEAPDVEALLVDWLNELLYLHETTSSVGVGFAFETLRPTGLRARVEAAPVGTRRASIKAATYHLLAVERREAGYWTEIVFDV